MRHVIRELFRTRLWVLGFLFVVAGQPGLAAPTLALPAGPASDGARAHRSAAPTLFVRSARARSVSRALCRLLPPRGRRASPPPASLPGRIHCVLLPLLR